MRWRTWSLSCGLLATLACTGGAARQAALWPKMRSFRAWDADSAGAPRMARTTPHKVLIEGGGWRRPGAIVAARFVEQDAALGLMLSDTVVADSAHRTGPRIGFRYRAELDHLRPTWAYMLQVQGPDSLGVSANLWIEALP